MSFLLLIVLAGAYSYSKYTTDVTGSAEIKIAKWNISVNGCPGDESGAIECSTSTEGNDYTVNVVVGNDGSKQISTGMNALSDGLEKYNKEGINDFDVGNILISVILLLFCSFLLS